MTVKCPNCGKARESALSTQICGDCGHVMIVEQRVEIPKKKTETKTKPENPVNSEV